MLKVGISFCLITAVRVFKVIYHQRNLSLSVCFLLIACFYMHVVKTVNPSAFNCDLAWQRCTRCPLCFSWGRRGEADKAKENSRGGTFKTCRASLIYPQTSLSLTLSLARDDNTITQDQMGVMSLLTTNGPWLTASFIVLNGVSGVPNDNATAYINVMVFENCSLYHSKCLHQEQSKKHKKYIQSTTWIKGLKWRQRCFQKLCWN